MKLGIPRALAWLGILCGAMMLRAGEKQPDLLNKSEDDALKLLGPPTSNVEVGDEKTLIYPDYKLTLKNGVIKKVVPVTAAAGTASTAAGATRSETATPSQSANSTGDCVPSSCPEYEQVKTKQQELSRLNDKLREESQKLEQKFREQYAEAHKNGNLSEEDKTRIRSELQSQQQKLRDDLGITKLSQDIEQLKSRANEAMAKTEASQSTPTKADESFKKSEKKSSGSSGSSGENPFDKAMRKTTVTNRGGN